MAMRPTGMGPMLAMLAVPVAGCAPSGAVPPASLRLPEPRLVEIPGPLPPLPDMAKGNNLMIEAYAQCRVAYADRSDKHRGLIDYVSATRR